MAETLKPPPLPQLEIAPALPTEQPGSAANLDRSLLRGIAWTGGVKWLSQVLTWVSTLVVARILTPDDYGLIGMASLFLGLVTLLNEFGIGAAVVTLRTLTKEQLKQLNALAIVFGFASFLVGCASAVPLSRFFASPQLIGVVVAMSTTFVITAFRTVPLGILQKDLRFRSLALLEGIQAIVLAMATVALALLGFGYWTLVIGNVLSALLSTALVVLRYPHPFGIPRPGALREAMRFSWHIIGGRLAWFVYSNADFLTVGRMLGKAHLGTYTIAWTLANVPIDKVTALVMRVTPAIFSAVQDDRPALRRYFLLVTEGTALVTFPVTVGLALVADDFVLAALGEKWIGAIAPLRFLALYASLRSLTPLLPQVLNVTGRTRYVMWNSVLVALVLPAGFVVGARWDTLGVALAWIVLHPLLIFPLLRLVLRELDLSLAQFAAALRPALTGTAAMCAAVLAGAALVPDGWPAVAELAVEVSAGAAVYVPIVLLLHRDRIAAFRRTLQRAPG